MATSSTPTTARSSTDQSLEKQNDTNTDSTKTQSADIDDKYIPPTMTRDFGFVPIPKNLRYNPDRPFKFTTIINVSFGFASTFTVMNLYYCQPLLIQFSESFNVTYDEVSRIPTLIQAGYATGLVLITPLGDLVRRRPLILLLILLSSSLTIGLAVCKTLPAFEALCYLVGVVTVVPQVLMPFAADLAPPNRRASALSIVLAGLLFGVLLARLLAGVIAQFTSWRVVYYMAIASQYSLLIILYFVLPDWPAKNVGSTYIGILYSMVKFAVTEPVLIQGSLINLTTSACFANFWVTLTFLLGGPPYFYDTLDIGLFGLVGMFGVAMGPVVGRVVDKLVPWGATLIATFICLAFQAIQTGGGGITVAAVVLSCFGVDVGRQMQQVSVATNVFSVSETARSRLNAVLILSIFIGQVMGTSVGTQVFTKYGWRPAAALSVAWTGFQLVIIFLRGPHARRFTWFGWEGGFECRRWVIEARERKAEEAEKMESEMRERGSVDEKKERVSEGDVVDGGAGGAVSEKEKEAFGSETKDVEIVQSQSQAQAQNPGDVV